ERLREVGRRERDLDVRHERRALGRVAGAERERDVVDRRRERDLVQLGHELLQGQRAQERVDLRVRLGRELVEGLDQVDQLRDRALSVDVEQREQVVELRDRGLDTADVRVDLVEEGLELRLVGAAEGEVVSEV